MRTPRAAAAAVFTGLFLVNNRSFLGLAASRPPSLSDAAGALAGTLGSAAAAAAFFALCWGVGRAALTNSRRNELRELRMHASILLGLGLMGTGVFLAGLAGHYGARAFLFAAVVAGPLALFGAYRHLPRPRLRGWAVPRGVIAGVSAGILAHLVWHALIAAAAPPADWDALAHHLAIPGVYLRIGRIAEIPWLLHSHWPHLLQVVYGIPLAFGLESVPAFLHAGTGALLTLAVFRVGRRESASGAGWIAAALFASQPAVIETGAAPRPDLLFAGLYFIGTFHLWEWRKNEGTEALLLAGVFAGLAAAAKLQGAILLAAWTVWIALFSKRRDRFKAAALYAAAGGVFLAPWLIKTWAGAGNPVWPLLPGVFGGKWGGPELAGPLWASNAWSFPKDFPILLRYGPQFLLAPLAVLLFMSPKGERLPPFVRFSLIPAIPYLILTAASHEAWRFFLPLYPALALAAGHAAARLLSDRTPGAIRAAAAAAVLFGVYPSARAVHNNQLFPFFGLRSTREPGDSPRTAYLKRALDHYPLIEEANRLLGPDDKVLLFREIRGYYLDRPYMWGDPVNQRLIPYANLDGPKALSARLKELGITHVLLNRGRYPPQDGYYHPRTVAMMESLLQSHGTRALKSGPAELYEIRHEP